MSKKFSALALLLLSGGCRMCADSCDYSAAVPGGPPLGTTRSGSNLSGVYYAPAPVPMPAIADEAAMPVTELPVETAP